MSSCPYIKFDYKKKCEVCKLTDKTTGVSLICDFDYDEKCAAYKKRQKRRAEK